MKCDDDVMGYRILMKGDDGNKYCNHIICKRHQLAKYSMLEQYSNFAPFLFLTLKATPLFLIRSSKRRFAEWTAKDFITDEATRRTFRVFFSSEAALKEFVEIFKQVS